MPNFGISWHAAPGVRGTDFAEVGYKFAERIGFDASLFVEHERFGAYRYTSILAQSMLADGGVSNTEDFSSFAFALDEGSITAIPGFHYHLAYTRLRKGRGNDADETGFAVAATYVAILRHGLEFRTLLEYVAFDGADGMVSQDRDSLTLAGQFTWRNWNTAVSFTGRNTETTGGTSTNDGIFQISAGYAFNFGLAVDIAWRHVEEAKVDTKGVGIRLAHRIEF